MFSLINWQLPVNCSQQRAEAKTKLSHLLPVLVECRYLPVNFASCVCACLIYQPSSTNAAGGRPGQCPPPSPRLAGCLRELGHATREAGLESSFDVTLEVTHHGPWLETPASE